MIAQRPRSGISLVAVAEVFVVGLEEAVIDAVSGHIRSSIQAEQDAVSVGEEEALCCVRLAAQLVDAGTDVDVKVGAAFEELTDPGQVLGIAADMGADECRLRMALHQVRQPGHDGHERRVGWTGEMPVGVSEQGLIMLVVLVYRVEKCHRVGDVDGHRQVELGGGFPQGVQAVVVHGDQLTVLVLHLQAEAFPDLEAFGAARCLLAQATSSPFSETVAMFRPGCPIHPAEDAETFWGQRP